MALWIVLGIVVVIVLWLIATYNGLVGGRNQAQTAWSQIDVQLKRRHDLIPNLVQVVKDAMGYEQETLTKVVQARNAAVAAVGAGPAQAGAAEAALTTATRGLLGLVESYPQLKANDNVKQLQEELTSTENKIAFSRQFYNDSVNSYNVRRQSFPAVLVAGQFGFGPMELFSMPESEREVPKVALR
ncbi:MAG TPA: LemA family protein [Reyranella sp.]|nr:LemA family protein [Reyranella sp.]